MSIDITGPHPPSKRSHRFKLTLQDHFTKWTDAIPLRQHTAVTVANVLFKNVFVHYGMSLRLLSDQGPEFESNLFQELCKKAGIQKTRTSPYEPRTNGMIELYHRTLNSMMAKVVARDQRDRDEKLPFVVAA